MKFSIYRYNPEQDTAPYMQDLVLDDSQIRPDMMLLDALLLLKVQDETLSFRRS
jgi:succinate dehydrogenase / fumarate reductase iron-sulfur subunit